MLLVNIFCLSIFKNHPNNSTILGQYIGSSEQDILEKGSFIQAAMATEHSPRTSTDTFIMEALEPSRGSTYIRNNSQDIPSSHTAISSLYQTQDVHHTTKAKRIYSQEKQIMGEKEELEMARYPNVSFEDLCFISWDASPKRYQDPKIHEIWWTKMPLHAFMEMLKWYVLIRQGKKDLHSSIFVKPRRSYP